MLALRQKSSWDYRNIVFPFHQIESILSMSDKSVTE